MATSVFIWPGIAPGGSFSGQTVGPAADNTANPPFTFAGDLDTGLGSSAANTLNLVTGGTSALTISATAATFAANVVGAFSRTALATTSTDGLTLTNSTAATGGATVQISPRFRLRGNAWDTAASQTVDFFLENLPATAATPTGLFKVGYSLNGAAASYPFQLASAGNASLSIAAATIPTTTALSHMFVNTAVFSGQQGAAGNFDMGWNFYFNGGFKYRLTDTAARISYNSQVAGSWSFLTAVSGTADAAITFVEQLRLGTTGVSMYRAVATAGQGFAPIYGYGDVAAVTNTGSASIATYTVGAADGTFTVSGNCLVTTSTTHSFSLDVTYTDEGNTARTLILPVAQLAGAFITGGLITNVTGAGPYETATLTIRAKASTAITVRTSAGGTFTAVVYNARGVISQVA